MIHRHLQRQLVLAALCACSPAQSDEVVTLIDLEQPLRPSQLATTGATAKRVLTEHGPAVRVHTGRGAQWLGVTLRPATGSWDLAEREYVLVGVRNLGEQPLRLFCRVGNRGHNLFAHSVEADVVLPPGGADTIEVTLQRPTAKDHRVLFGMSFYPVIGRGPLDASRVAQVTVFVRKPQRAQAFAVESVVAGGRYRPSPPPSGRLLPFIDRYGQYVHAEWPRKTHSDEDLQERQREEAADLEAHPGPPGRNRWGGFAAGPQLEATGAFRTEKYRGRWWLVDPDGRLFWSHGITCVRTDAAETPVTDREGWFAGLPEPGDPLARFYTVRSTVPFGYYQGKTYRLFRFSAANLMRKYGSSWPADFADLAHRRLRSWGMNTIGHYSSLGVCLQGRTPYTVGVVYQSPILEGSEGFWHKFPDVFDPDFRPALLRALNNDYRKTARDPWCVGYFVNNEMSWGGPAFLALSTLRSPPGQPAKRAFVEDLRGRHGTIEALNAAWGTAHASWEALLEDTRPPDPMRAKDDLLAFNRRTIERYFQTCKAAVATFAPERLYLGCRFTPDPNPLLVSLAAASCDVLSFNLYWRDLRRLELPEGVDRPVIIGEFDFAALDRGHFNPGIQKVPTQERRALAYERYVRSALAHDAVVGTHWFEYFDFPPSGVAVGHNFQSGFVDIADTPYTETIEACRRVAARLYEERLGGQ